MSILRGLNPTGNLKAPDSVFCLRPYIDPSQPVRIIGRNYENIEKILPQSYSNRNGFSWAAVFAVRRKIARNE